MSCWTRSIRWRSGCRGEIAIWSEQSPAWETKEARRGALSGRRRCWRPAGCWARSGWPASAALVDARLGQGHVILFGMRPQYRAQSYQTFKLFFNSLLD